MKLKSFLIALGLVAICGNYAAAEVILKVDNPAENSSVAKPLVIELLNAGGAVIATINVTNIVKGESKADKAKKIRDATPAVNKGSGGDGMAESVGFKQCASVRIKSDPTKEGFDKLNSNCTKDKAGLTITAAATASGVDPDGAQSSVRCGLDPTGIAVVAPSAGMSNAAILSSLKSQLDGFGINNTLVGDTLTLDSIAMSEEFVFGNSDTDLESEAELSIIECVPSVSEWGLVVLMLTMLSVGTIIIGFRRQVAMADGTTTLDELRPTFVPAVFTKVLAITLVATVAALAGAMFVFAPLKAVDIGGAFVSALVLAYLIHLWVLLKRE